MKFVLHLHIYQPYNQTNDILERVVKESYIPILDIIDNIDNAKIVLNISAALSTLLHEKGYSSLLNRIDNLIKQNKIEVTSTSMHHTILPLIPKDEITRQITLNNNTQKKYLKNYSPVGFFPTEMAVNNMLLNVIASYNYEWVGVPSFAIPNTKSNEIYTYKKLCLLPRDKTLSGLILSREFNSVSSILSYIKSKYDIKKDYVYVVMDGETFGHHRIGFEKLLENLLKCKELSFISGKELIEDPKIKLRSINSITASTWTNNEQDFWVMREKSLDPEISSFMLWKDPKNPIHKLQWNMTYYVINIIKNYSDKKSTQWERAREKLDHALASDHFWWASGKPWWSLEMIELGAYQLKEVVNSLSITKTEKNKLSKFYRDILDIAFKWHREGVIDDINRTSYSQHRTVPFKDRTHYEWYNQLILEFEDEMNAAATRQDYETAIKWRDAIYKLHLGTDMFDVSHVVDELWAVRSIPQIKPFFEHEYSEFSEFAKKYMLGFDNKQTYDSWKKTKIKKYSSNYKES